VSFELNGLWDSWDLIPYVLQQEVDGTTDRSAVGSEFRLATKNLDVFAMLDYDTLFDETNLFQFRGKYNLSKKTALKLTVDNRKNPLLATSNALIQMDEDVSISDLLDQDNIDETLLQEVAADRSGVAEFLSVGLSHEFSNRYQLNMEVNFSHLDSRYVESELDQSSSEILNTESSESIDEQTDYVLQLIINDWLQKNITAMFYLDAKTAENFDELIFSMEYRQQLSARLRFNGRLRYRDRDDENGLGIQRIMPAIKFDWRWSQDMRLFFEVEYEDWRYSGETLNEDFEVYQLFTGYNWDF
jgi:hypothetical protein